jgi:DNA-binding Lrp family transcriptional regulator
MTSISRAQELIEYAFDMPVTTSLDETDHEIVALLKENARRTFGDIGSRVALSPTAVKRRVDRLEEAGVITGYTATVDETLMGRPLVVFTELRISGTSDVRELVSVTAKLPEVEAIHVTAGDPDFLVALRVKDMSRLMAVINNLRRTRRVSSTKSLVVIDSWYRPQGTRSEDAPH